MSERTRIEFPNGFGSGVLLVGHIERGAEPLPTADTVHAYVDEQGYHQRAGEFAVGMLVCPKPVSQSSVDAALKTRPTHRCVENFNFHATDDCPYCRVLAASVARDLLRESLFVSYRFKRDDAPAPHPAGRLLQRHLTMLALAIPAMYFQPRSVVLVLERGGRGISSESMAQYIKEWIPVTIESFLRSKGAIPLRFPRVSTVIRGKEEAGLQLCDHILWRERREITGKPETVGEAGFADAVTIGPLDGTSSRLYVPHGKETPPMRSRPWPQNPSGLSVEELGTALLSIEANVHYFAARDYPSLSHLRHMIKSASIKVRDTPRMVVDDVVRLCRAFIVLVDTVPLYDVRQVDQAQKVSTWAGLAAIIARQREGRVMSLIRFWNDARQPHIESNNAYLLARGVAPIAQ